MTRPAPRTVVVCVCGQPIYRTGRTWTHEYRHDPRCIINSVYTGQIAQPPQEEQR